MELPANVARMSAQGSYRGEEFLVLGQEGRGDRARISQVLGAGEGGAGEDLSGEGREGEREWREGHWIPTDLQLSKKSDPTQ